MPTMVILIIKTVGFLGSLLWWCALQKPKFSTYMHEFIVPHFPLMECIKRKFCMDPLNSPETWDAKWAEDQVYMAEMLMLRKVTDWFWMLDFPQLTVHPNSAGSSQGQLGSLKKQIVGIVHQNQEFSIQNEDFPASPGFKGGNTYFPVDSHRKEQLHDSVVSMMQS